MPEIANNLAAVRERIRTAEAQWDREPNSVRLLAVSKMQPVAAIREAAAAGQQAFGENYLQEGLDKIAVLGDQGLEWHFIGSLQSNKTGKVAENFDWVHTVDRLRIARRLAEQRPSELPALNICLQVNISGEISKHGVRPADLRHLAEAVAGMDRLRIRGLMSIPAPAEDFEMQRQPHRRLRELQASLADLLPDLDTLSMGMSHDLEAAIAEGATLVRVGTAMFGERLG